MGFFLGSFEQTIDSKRRLAIASALREGIDPSEDGDKLAVVLGNNRLLWLYPDKCYARMLSKLPQRSKLPVEQARGITLMFGTAQVVKPDGQGRIVLPERSMRLARTDKEVTLVGQGDHIEIWPTKAWETMVDESMPTYGEMLVDASERIMDGEAP